MGIRRSIRQLILCSSFNPALSDCASPQILDNLHRCKKPVN